MDTVKTAEQNFLDVIRVSGCYNQKLNELMDFKRNGLVDSEKQAITDVVKNLVTAAEYPCILMGDFNMEPYEGLIQEIKANIKDTAPEEIDKNQLTYSSDDPQRKIDYIFADKNFAVEKAEALDVDCSDHRPYIAEVVLNRTI